MKVGVSPSAFDSIIPAVGNTVPPRYYNVYDPLGTYKGGREKAPAAVWRKIIEAKLSGKHEIAIWGNRHQTRSFMYIDNCLKGTIDILAGDIIEVLNLGSSELASISPSISWWKSPGSK